MDNYTAVDKKNHQNSRIKLSPLFCAKLLSNNFTPTANVTIHYTSAINKSWKPAEIWMFWYEFEWKMRISFNWKCTRWCQTASSQTKNLMALWTHCMCQCVGSISDYSSQTSVRLLQYLLIILCTFKKKILVHAMHHHNSKFVDGRLKLLMEISDTASSWCI